MIDDAAPVPALGRRRGIAVAGFVVVIAAAAAWHARSLSCIADDAYISFRYARHLVAGDGLVFNRGERVEGYTDFLWIVLIAGGLRCGASAEATALWLGAASLALLAAAIDALGRAAFGWTTRERIVALALLAALGPPLVACSNGLEMGLFAAVATAAAAAQARRDLGGGRRFAAPLLCSVALLLRPDGALVAAVVGTWALARALAGRGGSRRERVKDAAAYVAAFALLVAPHWIGRRLYYGAWLPNTYYVKISGANLAALGRLYLRSFAGEYWAFTGAALLGLAAAAWRGRAHRSGSPAPRAVPWLVVLAATWLVYVALVGGDYMPLYRMVVPAVPIGIVLATGLFGGGGDGSGVRAQGLAIARTAALAGLILASLVPSWRSAHEERRTRIVDSIAHERRTMAQWLAAGRRLREVLPPDTTIAVSNAGAIPDASGLFAIDQSGLCDRHTARVDSDPWVLDYPGHFIQATRAYLEERRPDLILWRPTIEAWRSTPPFAAPSASYVPRALALPELASPDGAPLYLYGWVRKEALPRLASAPLLEVGKAP
jgi:arabinofuranosyltransferase